MNPETLRAATGCTEATAIAFFDPINRAIKTWSIKRVPEFLAQIAVESARFTRLQENLNYRTPERLMQVWPTRFHSREFAAAYTNNPEVLANYVYGNRMGNTEDGDGWKYRGRGLKQLTGKENYKRYEAASSVPVVNTPDMLLDPVYAADSAGWYWRDRGCDGVADDVEQLTKRINGGLNGLRERQALTELARSVFA